MQMNRKLLLPALVAGALLLSPVMLRAAKPRATHQPRIGQRAVNNGVVLLQVKQNHPRKRQHTISGTVVSIHMNKQVPGSGTIKLRVHHHRKHNNQVAANANAAQQVAVKKAPCQRKAMAIGQQKKRTGHTVKVHFNKNTKFALTVKGLFDHLVKKTLGSGKAKTQVVINQPKVQTRNLPSHVRHVKEGQPVRVVLNEPHQLHNAKNVHMLHASVLAK
jgi:hypothetical protein